MLALPKSDAEKKVDARLAKTWPPYRQEWDGLDERRRQEDDFSRSVKAGILQREAGYHDDEQDRALGVLGGAFLGESPAIQTRSLSPRTWTGRHASLNVFSRWAAQVKATRNAHEAWAMFKSPPAPGLRPNFQVYAEMFQKLFAAPVKSSSTALPGDGREVFPVYDTNFSEFERSRLHPPSVAELYTQMLHDGSRPVNNCLAALIQNAPTLSQATQYLRDSPLDKEAVSLLHSTEELRNLGKSTSAVLRRIPLPIFNAYIALLCKLQPRFGFEPCQEAKAARIALIQQAIRATSLRLPPDSPEGRSCRAPWHTILRTLAAPRVLVSARKAGSSKLQDIESLSLFISVFTRLRDAMGLDTVLLESLCNAISTVAAVHSVRSSGASDVASESGGTADDLMRKAHHALVTSFHEMTRSTGSRQTSLADGEGDALEFPTLRHDISAAHMQAYIRALGHLGDTDELARTMHWILQVWDDETVLEHAKDPEHRQHAVMARAFVLFRALAEKHVSVEVMGQLEEKVQQLNKEKGCTWLWPTREEAEQRNRRTDCDPQSLTRTTEAVGVQAG